MLIMQIVVVFFAITLKLWLHWLGIYVLQSTPVLVYLRNRSAPAVNC